MTAGTWPSRRSARAAPLPAVARGEAFREAEAMTVLVCSGCFAAAVHAPRYCRYSREAASSLPSPVRRPGNAGAPPARGVVRWCGGAVVLVEQAADGLLGVREAD